MATNDGSGISRRDLLGLGGAAAGAALVGGLALPALPAGAQEAPLPQVPRRTLGKTGKTVPILLLGGMGLDKKFDPKSVTLVVVEKASGTPVATAAVKAKRLGRSAVVTSWAATITVPVAGPAGGPHA